MLITDHMIKEQPLFTASMSAYPYSLDYEARYKFMTNFQESVNMSVREGNTLYVPRETCPVGKEDHRVLKPRNAINCKFTPKNEEQGVIAELLIQKLLAGQSGICDAPTGWGKTVVGSFVGARVGQPTMFVVTKEDLLQQWKDSLIHVLGIPPAMVGHVQQDTCDWEGKQFVVGMAHSLIIPNRYPPEMYKYFGLLELDEVHMMAAETFIRICQKFPAKLRLGWSATVKRQDGKSAMLHAHIGPVIAKGTLVPMKSKVLVKRTGWRIPVEKRYNPKTQSVEMMKIPHAPGRMVMVVKAMAAHPGRNLELASFVSQAYTAGRRVLVLSDLIDHLKLMFHVVAQQGVPGEEIGYYIGGMKKEELNNAKNSRVILGTYKMCSTGTDVPQWDTLVLATPRSQIKQSVGRVLRAAAHKKQPVILDPVDADSIFNAFYLSRLKQYYEIGSEIAEMG